MVKFCQNFKVYYVKNKISCKLTVRKSILRNSLLGTGLSASKKTFKLSRFISRLLEDTGNQKPVCTFWYHFVPPLKYFSYSTYFYVMTSSLLQNLSVLQTLSKGIVQGCMSPQKKFFIYTDSYFSSYFKYLVSSEK